MLNLFKRVSSKNLNKISKNTFKSSSVLNNKIEIFVDDVAVKVDST